MLKRVDVMRRETHYIFSPILSFSKEKRKKHTH
jgi:hypothetical protein